MVDDQSLIEALDELENGRTWAETANAMERQLAYQEQIGGNRLPREPGRFVLDVNPYVGRRASKFKRNFNLPATSALLTLKTWVPEVEGNYEIIDRGFKDSHGEYYIYVFQMGKVIGYDPYGFPSREICIYFSWKAIYGDKLAIISAYPFSRCYHDFLKSRRLAFC